jgi:hypothetical protein
MPWNRVPDGVECAAAFATWAFVEPGEFRWTSSTERLGRYASSPGRARCFCTNCGSPLAAEHGGMVSEVVLAAIEGEPGVRPREHIFVRSKAPWHEITDSLPQHAEWPPGLAP